jgi:hypothetical protein
MQERVLIIRENGRGRPSNSNAPMGWLGSLVTCACDHAIGAHFAQGCIGTYSSVCECAHDREAVLFAAIDRVKK